MGRKHRPAKSHATCPRRRAQQQAQALSTFSRGLPETTSVDASRLRAFIARGFFVCFRPAQLQPAELRTAASFSKTRSAKPFGRSELYRSQQTNSQPWRKSSPMMFIYTPRLCWLILRLRHHSMLLALFVATGTKIKLPATCGAPRAADARAILLSYAHAARAYACTAGCCRRSLASSFVWFSRSLCAHLHRFTCVLCCAFGFFPSSPPYRDLKVAFDELGTSLEDMVEICGSGIFPSDVIDVR